MAWTFFRHSGESRNPVERLASHSLDSGFCRNDDVRIGITEAIPDQFGIFAKHEISVNMA
ncbi:MAG: hypothetical protein FWG73_06455 [Planctomycetaceae bacterium]|nr:hypothetical protein [Planctomycetaceae bacterium]